MVFLGQFAFLVTIFIRHYVRYADNCKYNDD